MQKVQARDIYRLCHIASKSKEGHIGSSLSILNILNAVYFRLMDSTDAFILSKGHASLGLYIMLEKYGYITPDQLNSFCEKESILGGHPNFRKVPGIFGSTGSLGHGLPMAVGKAMALKLAKSESKVVVLIGDGELNEGSNWEAFLLAAHHQLDNLVCIADFNKSSERALSVLRAPPAIKALGWDCTEIDGHDEDQILNALNSRTDNSPKFIWAHTIKGRGISFMEGNPEWHHKFPSEVELAAIAKELSLA